MRHQHVHPFHRSLSILGLGAVVLGGALIAGRGARVEATPGPTPGPRSSTATCPPTWEVFSTSAVLLQELAPGTCPGSPCASTPFLDSDPGSVDLDGDGVPELLSSKPRSSQGDCSADLAFFALRHVDGKARIETIFGGQPLEVPFAKPTDWLFVAGCADVTGDGLPDLIVNAYDTTSGGGGGGALGYFENILPPPSARSAADINRDGQVDALDLSSLLAAWGPVK